MPRKRLTGAQKRCPQVHRRDTSRVPRACGPCGQRGSRRAEDLTSKTVASLHGVPRVRFPRFVSTVKHSDFPSPLPRRFVSFASRYRRCALLRSRRRTGATPAGRGLFTGVPKPVLRTETTGPPRFLEGPTMNVPLLFDPGGTSALGHFRASVLPSAKLTASAPTTT
jgi:hypothetical protein